MSVRTIMLGAILVHPGIHRTGGVTYRRTNLEDSDVGDGAIKKWETEKQIDNREELKQAENLASSFRRKLRTVCARSTSFGLVCNESREDALDKIIEEIRLEAAAASLTLTTCTLRVSCVKGRIAADDKDAARALVNEVNEFIRNLNDAIEQADVETIRRLIADVKGLDELMTPGNGEVFRQAIEAARKAATTLKREVETKGRQKEFVLRGLDLGAVDVARMSFLELEDVEPVRQAVVDDERFSVLGEEVRATA